ncbi:galactokinase [Yinghuangia seranimata]|uniref:galactokinase n=1 Tax=Yinghuangia seranimata TaxID=408067 RepID=UPI00248CC863|nr:galactokinase [Yinghuangia seranimata]MDI2125844.1 galactokinase [Yinghuangia seranimata]
MTATFADAFGGLPKLAWRAPGRINVIGEHTDYNDGFVLPAAISYGVTASVAPRTDGLLRIASAQIGGDPAVVPLDVLAPGIVRGGAAYAAGVVWEMKRRGLPVAGVDIHLDGNVPQGAGLSSSAALEVAVATALDELWGLAQDPLTLVRIAQAAENDFVGMPCGIMDQSAAMLSRAGHALFLDTRDMATRQVPFDLTAYGLEIIVIDTRAPHRLVDGEYARRRRSCAKACDILGVSALRDIGIDDLARAFAVLDPVTSRRVRHVVTENERVLTAIGLLDAGEDPRAIGPLLTASHHSLRTDYEVTVPELDTAVEAALAAGAHGARMVGGGFGGSVIALVDTGQRDRLAQVVTATAERRRLAEPALFPVVAADGAHAVDVPAASGASAGTGRAGE